MNILILNSILYTAQNNLIPRVDSIKDCMIYNLAFGFKELGHTVTLVAASEYKPTKDEDYAFEVIFIPSNFKKIFLPSVLPLQLGLIHLLMKKRNKIDLIISSEVFSFPSLLSSILAPQKTVIWHELALHTRKMKGIPSLIWYNIISKIFFKHVTIIARSKDAKRFISNYLQNVSKSIVEHGVDLIKFQYSTEKKNQLVVVGQLIPRKNIENIILKFKKFISIVEYSKFKLIILGKGELESDLIKTIFNEGLINNVEMLGFKRHWELNKIVSESMALLIDTKQDNNMVSIPEAIVSGTPVLSNLIPTNSQMINENKIGIAKHNWTELDIKQIVDNNASYVEQCEKFRPELSTLYTAQKLIDCFIQKQ